MQSDETAQDGGRRPLCTDCDELADVLVAKGRDVTRSVWAYCDEHDPDPSVYGNRTTWDGKVVLRRYDQRAPSYPLYGFIGGDDHFGDRIMHVEAPTGETSCCGEVVPGGTEYSLEHALPDDARLCQRCLTSHTWVSNVRNDIVGRFLYQLRQVVEREDEVADFTVNSLDYPRQNAMEAHAQAEGFRTEVRS